MIYVNGFKWCMITNYLFKDNCKVSEKSCEETMEYCRNILVHSTLCKDDKCTLDPCDKMKKVIYHTISCQRRQSSRCILCKELFELCLFHAKLCKMGKCRVLFCNDVKSRLQQNNNDPIEQSNQKHGINMPSCSTCSSDSSKSHRISHEPSTNNPLVTSHVEDCCSNNNCLPYSSQSQTNNQKPSTSRPEVKEEVEGCHYNIDYSSSSSSQSQTINREPPTCHPEVKKEVDDTSDTYCSRVLSKSSKIKRRPSLSHPLVAIKVNGYSSDIDSSQFSRQSQAIQQVPEINPQTQICYPLSKKILVLRPHKIANREIVEKSNSKNTRENKNPQSRNYDLKNPLQISIDLRIHSNAPQSKKKHSGSEQSSGNQHDNEIISTIKYQEQSTQYNQHQMILPRNRLHHQKLIKTIYNIQNNILHRLHIIRIALLLNLQRLQYAIDQSIFQQPQHIKEYCMYETTLAIQ